MIDVNEAIERVQGNSGYQNMLKDYKKTFFYSGLGLVHEKRVVSKWILSYYLPNEKKAIAFEVNDSIIMNTPEELAKKIRVKPLDIKKASVLGEKALLLADEHYNGDKPNTILLNIKYSTEHSTIVWEVSYIAMLKVKSYTINAETGGILGEKKQDFLVK